MARLDLRAYMLVSFGRIMIMLAARRPWPWMFFLLVLLLSIPFYGLGAAGGRLPILTVLPISALMACTPIVAALILVWRERGAEGVVDLLKRALDFGRSRSMRWYLVAVCLLPIVAVLQYVALRLAGSTFSAPHFAFRAVLLYVAMFFIGAIGEELGWQGYAFPELSTRYSALGAALILGVFWALWHVIPFIEAGRGADWILWHGLSMVAMRVIIVWLFVNTGQSVFIAVVFHTMSNIPWGVIANYESFYDPFTTFLLLTLVAGLVTVFWGPATLARFRNAQ